MVLSDLQSFLNKRLNFNLSVSVRVLSAPNIFKRSLIEETCLL